MLVLATGPGQSGPLGLLVVVLLCAAAYLLFRSFRTHLGRVPRSFDEPKDQPNDSVDRS